MTGGLLVALGVVAALYLFKRGASSMGDQLGKYFTVGELLVTGTGLPNVPSAAELEELYALVELVLDPLRDWIGAPLVVTSGFRSADVNEAVGGARASYHLKGQAADLRPPPGYSAEDLATKVYELHQAGVIEVGECIWYDPERGGHLHITSSRVGELGQFMHAPSSGGYVSWAP